MLLKCELLNIKVEFLIIKSKFLCLNSTSHHEIVSPIKFTLYKSDKILVMFQHVLKMSELYLFGLKNQLYKSFYFYMLGKIVARG